MSLTRTRSMVAAAAAATLVAVGLTVASAQAAAGCRVTYTITNQWPTGFGASVNIDNLGDPVNGWRLTWSFGAGQTITQLWSGSFTQSGADVTVTNATWNGSIPTNGGVSFGFNGSTSGSNNPVPASFALNGTTCSGTVPSTSPTTTPTSTPPPTSTPTPTPTPTPTSGPSSFSNPVVWQDFADVDIIRVDNAYYMSASTMHYSPGAPILRSYDLVNWEFAGHSVPSLADFENSAYNLSGGRAYVKGIWASTLNYRRSNSTYYWIGCTEFNRTYVYTATTVEGPWQKRSRINNCYYDAGLLVDDNDTMYVAYGNSTISVAQLSADGLSQVRAQQVFQTPSSVGTLEGARFYKRNGSYYIWLTRPANGQYVLKASNPFGPYEMRQVLLNLPGPISGGGVPHQGGLVQTQNGDWYYMSFVDAYPGGRVPALAPITWSSDGWPVLQTVNGAWGASYPKPNLPPPPRAVKPLTGVDTFAGTTLGPQYEWNHVPDNSRWSVNDGLRLQTATVTNDLYNARNTLTHRIQGPSSTATIELNYSGMANGDRAGLAMLRDSSAWIGVRRDNGTTRVVMTNNLTMNSSWQTTGTGSEQAGAAVSGGRIWLRVNADVRPGSGRQARFSYSTDGVNFTNLGPGFTLNNAWQFFMGYRFGIFNYATAALGGSVTVSRFDLTTP
ncbi:family 43 glycosylhydrolase [Plantactinospora sp. S1510]|uniref:Family 43 glycosylhydrolase n=1 Tax=Plantactinospora alkalitolerans TaxID=2789879 RepID=A0ABS0H611_9ACTN|nr:family 43 glycosylhydrolase [Plantactinospora alkalitolerans]MBF9133769.1 family 43 glycosylhydrolase [Plantactinospora alkalitolerans]